MSYRYYTDEYRKQMVEEFFLSGSKLYPFCRSHALSARTFYYWVHDDDRFNCRAVKRGSVYGRGFSLEIKLAAVNARKSGKLLRAVAAKFGTTPMMVANWTKIYEEKGDAGLMTKTDFKKKSANQESVLEQENKELRQKNYQLQLENDVLKAARQVLKNFPAPNLKESLLDLTNSQKAGVIRSLGAKHKLVDLLKCLEISSSSYYRAVETAQKPDKYEEIRRVICDLFEKMKCRYGVKRIWKTLLIRGYSVGRDVVRKIMRQENLVVLKKKSIKRYDSYDSSLDTSYAPNLLQDHDFHADLPFQKMTTDITEFKIPAGKVYLSPVLDLFDHGLLSWSISLSPDANMTIKMLDDLKRYDLPQDALLHSDRGCQYHSWRYVWHLQELGLTQSMSRKGCSPDNSAMEGFFGRLKNEFFHRRDFDGLSLEEFSAALNDYLLWYNIDRIMLGLDGGMSPNEYRKKHGYQLVA